MTDSEISNSIHELMEEIMGYAKTKQAKIQLSCNLRTLFRNGVFAGRYYPDKVGCYSELIAGYGRLK